jgi:hypothetical protein
MSATEPQQGLDRRDLIRLGGLIAVLLAVVAIVVLAGDGGSSERSRGQIQGVLIEVSQSRLVLEPTAGGSRQTFSVRPEDAERLDFFHLQQHAEDSLQSIVHYDEVDGTRFATRVDDAP